MINKLTLNSVNTLSIKQKAFLHHYIRQGLNGARAWRVLHPNTKQSVAEVSASRMLSNVKVQTALTDLCNEVLEGDMAILKMFIRSKLEAVANADIGEFVTWDEKGVHILPSKGKDTRAVRSVRMTKGVRYFKDGAREETVRVQVDLKDDVEALDKLAKILGMYNNSDVNNGDIIYVEAPLTDGWKGQKPL